MLNSALPCLGFSVRMAPGFTYCVAAAGRAMTAINKAINFLFIIEFLLTDTDVSGVIFW